MHKHIKVRRALETAEALHPVRSCNHIVTPHIPLRTSHRTSTPTQALLIITLDPIPTCSHRNPAAPLDSAPCRPRRLFFAPSGFYSRACLRVPALSRLPAAAGFPPREIITVSSVSAGSALQAGRRWQRAEPPDPLSVVKYILRVL